MALGTLLTYENDPTTGGLKRRGGSPTGGEPTSLTLFDENFDTRPLGAMTQPTWSSIFGVTGSSRNLSRSSIVNDDVNGGRAFRATLLANTTGTSNGVIAEIPLPIQVEEATFKMTFRYTGAFPWIKGGKLPGLGGVGPGVSTNHPTGGNFGGSLGWSGRHMWLASTGDSNWPDGVGTSYHYGFDQLSQYGDHLKFTSTGASTGTPVTYDVDTFHTVEAYYKVNTPGSADGIIRVWLDDALVVERTNKQYRDNTNVKISHLYWHIFRGGSTSEWWAPTDDYIDITHFSVVAVA